MPPPVTVDELPTRSADRGRVSKETAANMAKLSELQAMLQEERKLRKQVCASRPMRRRCRVRCYDPRARVLFSRCCPTRAPRADLAGCPAAAQIEADLATVRGK